MIFDVFWDKNNSAILALSEEVIHRLLALGQVALY